MNDEAKSPRRPSVLIIGVVAVLIIVVVGVAARAHTGTTDGAPAPSPGSGVGSSSVGGSGYRVAFMGDSLTHGLYASSPTRGWRPLVEKGLRQRHGPVDAVTDAKSGITVSGLATLHPVPSGVDLAIVELGTNDVRHTPASVFTRQYLAFVQRVRAGSPHASILCLGSWQPAVKSAAWDRAIAAACARVSGTYLALSGLYAHTDYRGPAGRTAVGGIADDFHPNDRGYAAIAALVLAHIR
jgi:acyl-CoA thioesterase I